MEMENVPVAGHHWTISGYGNQLQFYILGFCSNLYCISFA